MLAYGMLNTIYYTATFWYMWTHVYKVPKGMSRDLPSIVALLCFVVQERHPGLAAVSFKNT